MVCRIRDRDEGLDAAVGVAMAVLLELGAIGAELDSAVDLLEVRHGVISRLGWVSCHSCCVSMRHGVPKCFAGVSGGRSGGQKEMPEREYGTVRDAGHMQTRHSPTMRKAQDCTTVCICRSFYL